MHETNFFHGPVNRRSSLGNRFNLSCSCHSQQVVSRAVVNVRALLCPHSDGYRICSLSCSKIQLYTRVAHCQGLRCVTGPAVGQHHQGLQVYTREAWGTTGAGERLAFGPLPPLQHPRLLATKYLQAAVNERAHTSTALTGPEFPNRFLIPKKLWKRPKLLLPEA